MKGVKFDDKHSYNDYGMWLNSYEIGEAEPNLKLVEVPGADGALDFTEYFGGVTYKNREIKMQFTFRASRSELNRAYGTLQNAINGKRLKIILDDDKENYYVGRIAVGALKPDGQLGTVEITAQCEPYRYKLKTNSKTCSGKVEYKQDGISTWLHATVTNYGGMPVAPVVRSNIPFYISETKTMSGGSSETFYRTLHPANKDVEFPKYSIAPGVTKTFGFCGYGDMEATITLRERSL